MNIKQYLVDESFQSLLWPARHMPLLTLRRVETILFRVRLVALLFAFLTAGWIVVDFFAVPWPAWGWLAAGRLVASLAFAFVALICGRANRKHDMYLSLACLYAIPTFFYLYSYWILSGVGLSGLTSSISGIYAFLPFIMIAGLGMFPLTAGESLIYAMPVILLEFVSGIVGIDALNLSELIGSVWLAAMMAIVAALSGMSQLGFMIALVRQAIRDPLTQCFTRSSGEELLEMQFIIATRSNSPLTLAFIDLDNFKAINDNYGHDAGDKVLLEATRNISQSLRTGDMLVRWGGEEFVVILPGAYCNEAALVLERLLAKGMGERPDGQPITASVGLAERTYDDSRDWRELIAAADQRMYSAKQSGKNRLVTCARAA